jgi:hypothetical protein
MQRKERNAVTAQQFRREAGFRHHPADDVVAPFAHQKADVRFRVAAMRHEYLLSLRKPVFEVKTLKDLLHRLICDNAAKSRGIDFGHAVARVRKDIGQFAVVGQENQALGVLVKPAHGVHPARLSGNKPQDGRSAEFIRRSAQNAGRLVEKVIDLALLLDLNAVHFDARRFRVGLYAHLSYEHAIDGDAALGDDLFAFAPRSHARVGEYLL